MADQRPSTPLPVRRLLRQEAGFGCCVCGIPILQYHHIIPYHEEAHFRPEDMMALCPTHHDMMTKGAADEYEQRRYKAKPSNIERGFADGQLKINQDYCAVLFGTSLVVNEGPVLAVKGEALISLNLGEKNNLELSVRLYDEKGKVALETERNDWISGDPLPWDIEADWQKLKIRHRKRKIAIDLDATRNPMRIRGNFWKDKLLVQIDSDGIKGGNVSVQGITLVGWAYNINPDSFSMGPPPGGPRDGMMLYDGDFARAIAEWRALKTRRLKSV